MVDTALPSQVSLSPPIFPKSVWPSAIGFPSHFPSMWPRRSGYIHHSPVPCCPWQISTSLSFNSIYDEPKTRNVDLLIDFLLFVEHNDLDEQLDFRSYRPLRNLKTIYCIKLLSHNRVLKGKKREERGARPIQKKALTVAGVYKHLVTFVLVADN